MTAVDELRAAASKIRGFAGIAPKGPWCAYPGNVTTDWHPNSEEWRRGQSDEDVASNTGASSEHIALWHPGVAELVAQVLEGQADVAEPFQNEVDYPVDSFFYTHLTLARAINGTEVA